MPSASILLRRRRIDGCSGLSAARFQSPELHRPLGGALRAAKVNGTEVCGEGTGVSPGAGDGGELRLTTLACRRDRARFLPAGLPVIYPHIEDRCVRHRTSRSVPIPEKRIAPVTDVPAVSSRSAAADVSPRAASWPVCRTGDCACRTRSTSPASLSSPICRAPR